MTTPRSSTPRGSSPARNGVGGMFALSRQQLIWVLCIAMFFSCFLGWQHRFSYDGAAFQAQKSSSTRVTAVNDSQMQMQETTVVKVKRSKAFQVHAMPKNRTTTVKQISLIGERNSGTKWMWAHLHDCFHHAIPVEKKFSRYKHWFQPNDPFRYPHDTLVIAEFRNPYDWLMAMYHVPHHSPAHAGVDWKTFLTKTWTTKRIGLDLDLKGDEMCQHHFLYKDLISCIHKPEPWVPVDNRTSLDKPFYEMRNDGSGEPYDNIMEMRSDKIRNTLDILDFEGVADLWMVQYEYMLSQGTKGLLDRITEWTGIEPKCKPFPPQERRQREVPEEFIQFITNRLNWTAEAFIGYEPIRPIQPVTEEDDAEEEFFENDDDDSSDDQDDDNVKTTN